MLKGIDVSYWQSTTPLDQAPDFVIVRAGYGTTIESRFHQHYDAARSAGKILGIYWYGQPDAAGTDAEQEADAFANAITDRLGEATLWLDFEGADNAIWGQQSRERDWVSRFIHRLHDRTGVWSGLYIQGSAVGRVYPAVADVSALWMAAYPDNVTTFDQAANRQPPEYGSPVSIWQFTSSLNGRSLDGNLFYGDEDAWLKLANGDSATVSAPPAPSAPLVVDGIVGPLTITLYQRRHGLTPDGIAGPRTVTSLQEVTGAPTVDGVYDGQRVDLIRSSWPALTSYTTRGTSPDAKALQAFLSVQQDGLLGPDSARGFQTALNAWRL